jgi:bifunctional UDP-N-acetylglucosamine pyrophosphorylase/glucosamine-1-phosphate N-acetyltransferase
VPVKHKIVAIVLAAGQGTRMRSGRAKVLHEILGRPMVAYPVAASLEAGAAEVVVVVGHQGELVEAALRTEFPGAPLRFAVQTEQRGTGHAVQCALPQASGDQLLLLCGDTPALDAKTLHALIDLHLERDAALTLTSFVAADPTGYGRVVRAADGHPVRIVEERDADPNLAAIREVNAGLYLVERDALVWALGQLSPDNAQSELYLTDTVALLGNAGRTIAGMTLQDPSVVAGVNTRAQLAELEATLSRRINRAWMEAGVTIQSPETVRIEPSVRIEVDAVIGPQVQLRGRTRVGRGARVDTGSILVDCTLAEGAQLRPYVVAEDVELASGASAGPFAHLRTGTRLGAGARIGNFVETKKATLGEGSKANHLAYLGDCEIGRDVNLGAGTITCNYDGFDKHRTVLEDGVFVGSDTQLVAPVRVGKNATVGAGTTVTRDVPAGALVTSRVKQAVREGYYEVYRAPRAAKKRREE